MFLLTPILSVCALFVSPVLAQETEFVLVRQAPVVSEPFLYKTSTSLEQTTIRDGGGTFKHSVRGAGETEDRWNISGTVTFKAPPAQIVPGQTFSLKANAELTGYTKSGSPGAQLVYYVESGGKVLNNVLNLKSSEFKEIDGYKRKGSHKPEINPEFVISKSAGDNLKIRVMFGSSGRPSVLYTYKKTKRGSGDPVASQEIDPCQYDSDFEQLRGKYNTLERIKSTPELFALDVRYSQHPFEICIKDGVATLNAEAELWQKIASGASKILTAYIGVAPPAGAAGALVSGKAGSGLSAEAGRVSAQVFRETAVSRAKAAGVYTIGEIRSISSNSKVIENFSKAAISTALKDWEPATIARSAFSKQIQTLYNGGPVVVPANEGLEIYNQLLISAEIVRANSKAAYCKLLDSQFALANELRDLARKAAADSSNQCAADFLSANREEIRSMLAELRHDISFAGDGSYISRHGTNWTLDSQYSNLKCAIESREKGAKFSTKF